MIIEQKGDLFIQNLHINFGRRLIETGEKRHDHYLKRHGIKIKCIGLILQNPTVEALKKENLARGDKYYTPYPFGSGNLAFNQTLI